MNVLVFDAREGQQIIIILRSVKTVFEAHLAPYSMGTGGLFPWV